MRGIVVRGKSCLPLAAVAFGAALSVGCTTTTVQPTFSPQPKSWTEKLSAGIKNGPAKLASAFGPKESVSSIGNVFDPKKKPSPTIHVAWAEVQERAGNIEQAETQLREALAIDPNHVGALLAYAHLEDRQRNFQAALKYYDKALKKHSKDANVHNDLGLCCHRHNKLNKAATALGNAVQLEPYQKLYRDNLAAVLVDQGKTPEALAQLIEAHGQPVGHYNLGYLLVQKRDTPAALHHFRRAAQLDPSFGEARQWIAQLSRPAGPPVATRAPVAMLAQRQQPGAGYAPGSIVPAGTASQYPPDGRATANRYSAPPGAPPSSRRLPPNPVR